MAALPTDKLDIPGVLVGIGDAGVLPAVEGIFLTELELLPHLSVSG